MAIGIRDHKLLWGRAGARCAICRHLLVADETELDAESMVGEEAHIVGRKEKAARGTSLLSSDDRDKYPNLILLCLEHHKIVDDQESTYPIEELRKIKQEHEKWVRETLDPTVPAKIKDEMHYLDIIEEWEALSDLTQWLTWTSNSLSSEDPMMTAETIQMLRHLREFVYSRIWPGSNLQLEQALKNLVPLLNDIIRMFDAFFIKERSDCYYFNKFYKETRPNPNYERDVRDYSFYVYLFEDLVLELTRATNRICDAIRATIDDYYRRSEGALLVQYGPTMTLQMKKFRPEYRGDQSYRSLKSFYEDRKTRDFSFFDAEEDSEGPEHPFV